MDADTKDALAYIARSLAAQAEINLNFSRGGNNGGMDDTLRADVATLKTDVEVIKSNYATKHDVAQSEATIIKWMVGIGLVLGTVVIGYLNFSKPPSPPASVQPIIIQVPVPGGPVLPPPQKN